MCIGRPYPGYAAAAMPPMAAPAEGVPGPFRATLVGGGRGAPDTAIAAAAAAVAAAGLSLTDRFWSGHRGSGDATLARIAGCA
jgi:hypothetical protein